MPRWCFQMSPGLPLFLKAWTRLQKKKHKQNSIGPRIYCLWNQTVLCVKLKKSISRLVGFDGEQCFERVSSLKIWGSFFELHFELLKIRSLTFQNNFEGYRILFSIYNLNSFGSNLYLRTIFFLLRLPLPSTIRCDIEVKYYKTYYSWHRLMIHFLSY